METIMIITEDYEQIPYVRDGASSLSYMDRWREASEQNWRQARWINGIDACTAYSGIVICIIVEDG